MSKNINFRVFSYVKDLHKFIKKKVILQYLSGASTINELVFLGTSFLAIPYPFAKDDHQFYNAKYFVKKNLGWLTRETNVKKIFI